MSSTALDGVLWRGITNLRATAPHRIAEAYAARKQRPSLVDGVDGTMFLVAADHPARGALSVGTDPLAMGDRRELLGRLAIALARPGVDGLLATPDVVEDLLLLGELTGERLLDNRIVIGSMNRGGLAGGVWELDDPFTGYDVESIAEYGLDGGKMLLRIDNSDPGTRETLVACAAAVTALARRRLMAMVEPLPYTKNTEGRAVLDRDPAALVRAAAIAAGLGVTSAYTWLKLPATDEAERVMATTSLPGLLLGGVPRADPAEDLAAWCAALRPPTVRGLVVGRTLLYPPDGDVAGVVDAATAVLREAKS